MSFNLSDDSKARIWCKIVENIAPIMRAYVHIITAFALLIAVLWR